MLRTMGRMVEVNLCVASFRWQRPIPKAGASQQTLRCCRLRSDGKCVCVCVRLSLYVCVIAQIAFSQNAPWRHPQRRHRTICKNAHAEIRWKTACRLFETALFPAPSIAHTDAELFGGIYWFKTCTHTHTHTHSAPIAPRHRTGAWHPGVHASSRARRLIMMIDSTWCSVSPHNVCTSVRAKYVVFFSVFILMIQ